MDFSSSPRLAELEEHDSNAPWATTVAPEPHHPDASHCSAVKRSLLISMKGCLLKPLIRSCQATDISDLFMITVPDTTSNAQAK